jgi:predicted  nucleic acid-binding Zn-ribbon protein
MHKCTKCGTEYETEELINMKGCANCGSTLFIFSKTKKFENVDLNEQKIQEIEHKIKNNPNEIMADVRVIDNGIFSINLNTLSKNKPIVVEGEEGVYFIKFK